MAQGGDDLAILAGVLVSLLFYTCLVLGFVKVCRCTWLDDDDAILDSDNIGLPSRLLPEARMESGEEDEIVGLGMDGPQNV